MAWRFWINEAQRSNNKAGKGPVPSGGIVTLSEKIAISIRSREAKPSCLRWEVNHSIQHWLRIESKGEMKKIEKRLHI